MLRNTIGLAAVAAAVMACSASGTKLTVSSQTKVAAASSGGGSTAECAPAGLTLDEVWLVVRHVEIEGGDLCAPPATPPPTPPPPAPGLRTASNEGECQDATGGSGGETCDGEHDDDDQGETCEDSDHDGLDDDCGEGDGECELSFGPFGVVLSAQDLASGKVSHEFDVTVPPGTYEELEILVNTIPANKAGDDAVLQQMAAEHASVLVRGKVGDEAFTWTTNVAFKQEVEPFTIPAEGGNVTLQLDTSGWFCKPGTCDASTGACDALDPGNPDDRTEIARNIRASFRVLHDDDRDGHDDEDENDDGDGMHP